MMNTQDKISPFVRVVSGLLGVLGFAAIAFNASNNDGIKPDFLLFASFFVGFIFLYVVFYAKYPWDRTHRDN